MGSFQKAKFKTSRLVWEVNTSTKAKQMKELITLPEISRRLEGSCLKNRRWSQEQGEIEWRAWVTLAQGWTKIVCLLNSEDFVHKLNDEYVFPSSICNVASDVASWTRTTLNISWGVSVGGSSRSMHEFAS
ncbi:DNA topoisomerase I alpha [Striga asiatica]|uniref:DNA topoisomerase I alpha n=1 Tax=Striga asiatica TaxID=4170 RepID=A0A5A7PV15_STRAF|nr:DNA topoisomerase I alpha [Striga asiatica]